MAQVERTGPAAITVGGQVEPQPTKSVVKFEAGQDGKPRLTKESAEKATKAAAEVAAEAMKDGLVGSNLPRYLYGQFRERLSVDSTGFEPEQTLQGLGDFFRETMASQTSEYMGANLAYMKMAEIPRIADNEVGFTREYLRRLLNKAQVKDMDENNPVGEASVEILLRNEGKVKILNKKESEEKNTELFMTIVRDGKEYSVNIQDGKPVFCDKKTQKKVGRGFLWLFGGKLRRLTEDFNTFMEKPVKVIEMERKVVNETTFGQVTDTYAESPIGRQFGEIGIHPFSFKRTTVDQGREVQMLGYAMKPDRTIISLDTNQPVMMAKKVAPESEAE